MSKSTLINQIPGGGFANNTNQFINEPQRQMVTQAQNAVQNFPMPQMQSDVIPENENSIQDMLNELSSGSVPQMQEQLTMPPPPQTPPSHQHHPMMSFPQPSMLDSSLLNDMQAAAATGFPGMQHDKQPMSSVQNLVAWNNDIKTVTLAMGLFIVISALPIEKYVGRYVALERIPYSHVLVKAVVFGILLYFTSKFV